MSKVIMFIS